MLSSDERYGLLLAQISLEAVQLLISLAALFIAGRYANFTRFKNLKIRASHPLHLIAMKTLCDGALVATQLGSHVVAVSDTTKRYHANSTACLWQNPVQEFLAHASSAWFFLLSVDLFLASRNPFSVPTGYYKFYHVFVWAGSAVAVAIIRVTVDHQSALTSLCYLDDDHSHLLSFRSILRMFPLMFVAALLASVYILLRVNRIFNRVVLHPARRQAFQHGLNCIKAYGLIGLLRLLVSGSIYLAMAGNNNYLWSIAVDSFLLLLEHMANLTIVIIAIAGATSSMRTTSSADLVQERQPLLQGDIRTFTSGELSASTEAVEGGINRELRDDVMLSSLFGIIASLNRKSQPAAGVCRSKVALPPSYGRELDFVDYERRQFANLRMIFDITDEMYTRSLWGPKGEGDIKTMSQYFTTGGRSGSFFYLTHDRRFIVKTITRTERELLRRRLPEYHQHMQNNPNSLLTRLCGLYAMRLSPEQRFITILVQLNVAAPSLQADLPHLAFDLKGSTVNRRITSEGEHPRAVALDTSTKTGMLHFKDSDLKGAITIGPVSKAALSSALTNDAAFLHTHGLMDYSLLVVLYFLAADTRADEVVRPSQQLRHGLPMTWQGRAGVVRFGVIDFLQEYTWAKRLERWWKTWFGLRSRDVSSVNPDAYAERFLREVLKRFA
eukprot:TRINITY_DN7894_c0_g1_i1.p1 TRINITY_DN7894_c0_g1~~TRINITY_DN7894_c0_g1_i1.p1  ORF type:complete len:668 (+),score=104.72 TRINITY_DN7894_c0_g1_i1:98-2101(+)